MLIRLVTVGRWRQLDRAGQPADGYEVPDDATTRRAVAAGWVTPVCEATPELAALRDEPWPRTAPPEAVVEPDVASGTPITAGLVATTPDATPVDPPAPAPEAEAEPAPEAEPASPIGDVEDLADHRPEMEPVVTRPKRGSRR